MSKKFLLVGGDLDHGARELLKLLEEIKLMTVEEYNILYEEVQKDLKEIEQRTTFSLELHDLPKVPEQVIPPKTKYKKNRRFWE